MEPDNRKEHILQHVQHDGHARGQQLGPDGEVELALDAGIDAVDPANQAAQYNARDELARPGDARGVKGEVKVVALVAGGVVKGEVGVHLLVGAKVQHQDAAQKSEHAHVLGQKADKDVADADLLVRGVRLRRQAEESHDPVVRRRHSDGRYNDEQAG